MDDRLTTHKEALLDIILKMKAQKNMISTHEDVKIEPNGKEKKYKKDHKGKKEMIDDEMNKESMTHGTSSYAVSGVNPETPLSISTITATGSVGCNINMASFYKYTHIDDLCDTSIKRDGFTYIEWGQKGQDTLCRGLHKKMTIKHKRSKEGKRFDKQITVILRRYDPDNLTFQYQNLKIFYNGMIQMTGLKSCEQGMWVLQFMIDRLRSIKEDKDKDPNIYDDELTLSLFGENALKPHDYSIRLINTNFCLGYAINRRVLCNYLNANSVYNVFEASRYPGVKIPFYWNSKKVYQDGMCVCKDQVCMKKTRGRMGGEKQGCHKTTIIVFQSGSVIITGGQSMQHIEDSYLFIRSIFEKIKDIVIKPYTRAKYSKMYPKFSYNTINDKKRNVINLPHGYKFDNEEGGEKIGKDVSEET